MNHCKLSFGLWILTRGKSMAQKLMGNRKIVVKDEFVFFSFLFKKNWFYWFSICCCCCCCCCRCRFRFAAVAVVIVVVVVDDELVDLRMICIYLFQFSKYFLVSLNQYVIHSFILSAIC